MFRQLFNLVLFEQDNFAEVRRRLVTIFALFAMATIALLSAVPWLTTSVDAALLADLPDSRALLGAVALWVVVIGLVLVRRVAWASNLLVASLALMAVYVRLVGGETFEGFAEVFVLLMIMAFSTLQLARGVIGLLGSAVLLVFIAGLGIEIAEAGALEAAIFHDVIIIPVFTLLLFVTRYFVEMLQNSLALSRDNVSLLQASADIGQIATEVRDLDTLVQRGIEVIRRRYDLYQVRVFLLNDSRDQAVLVASVGEAAEMLPGQDYRLAVGSQSVIGQVTLRGEPIMIADTRSSEGLASDQQALPDAHSQLALPLVDEGRIIGALAVYSRHTDAFSPPTIRSLRVIANLVATAIRNARLFDEQRAISSENQHLLTLANERLTQIEALNQQLTERSWQSYTGEQQAVNGVTLDSGELHYDATWSPTLAQASQQRMPVIQQEAGHRQMAVPIILRGAVIGAIEVEPGENIDLPDAEELLSAVAQRLAVSLDNARLFEESQEAAVNEQRINEIVSSYQQANSVDDLLRITLTELSQSLGAERGAIRLGGIRRNGHA